MSLLNSSSLNTAPLNGSQQAYNETPDGKRSIVAVGWDTLLFSDRCFIGAADRIYGRADVLQIKPDEEDIGVVLDVGGLV